MKKLLTIACLLIAVHFSVSAQVDTINAKNNKLVLQNLKDGKTDYLVYFIDSLGRRNGGDIWQRSVSHTTFKNQPAIRFSWQWLHNDSVYATIVHFSNAKTLAPIYRHGNYKNRGIFAYDFQEDFMVPSDTIANNLALKKPKVALTLPVISWEFDLETYALLPIKKVGQKFDIAFFDPNEKAPSYHRYEVIGKEDLEINRDTKVKCWLLKIDYRPGSHATFWLTEKSKEVIKMKEFFNGRYRIKVKQF